MAETRTFAEQQARATQLMLGLQALKGQLGSDAPVSYARDPVAMARELYVTGKISVEDFEARLDVVFKVAAA